MQILSGFGSKKERTVRFVLRETNSELLLSYTYTKSYTHKQAKLRGWNLRSLLIQAPTLQWFRLCSFFVAAWHLTVLMNSVCTAVPTHPLCNTLYHS